MAAALGISGEQVGIKATTNEGLGALGEGKGIAAWAVALIAPWPPGLSTLDASGLRLTGLDGLFAVCRLPATRPSRPRPHGRPRLGHAHAR